MTELEQMAERAWAALLNDVGPIPPGVALDMVQDVCGDRAAANAALHSAAVDHLAESAPEGGTHSTSLAVSVGERIVLRLYDAASGHITTLLAHNREIRSHVFAAKAHHLVEFYTDADDALAAEWLRWGNFAHRVLIICRALSAEVGERP